MQSQNPENSCNFSPAKGPPDFLSMLVTQELSGVFIPAALQERIKFMAHTAPCELSGYFTGFLEKGVFHVVDNTHVGEGGIAEVDIPTEDLFDPLTRWKDDFKLVSARRSAPNLQTLLWHSHPFIELGPLVSHVEGSEQVLKEVYGRVESGEFHEMFGPSPKDLFINGSLIDAVAFITNSRALGRFDLPLEISLNARRSLMDLAKMCGFMTEDDGKVPVSDLIMAERAVNHIRRGISEKDIEAIPGPQVIVRPWPESHASCEILPFGKSHPFSQWGPPEISLNSGIVCSQETYQSVDKVIDDAKASAEVASKKVASALQGNSKDFSLKGFCKFQRLSGKMLMKFEGCDVLNDWVESVSHYAFN